ncbi:MAG: thioredoxin family protein [Myxococcales bacterium]|nr:thioredoxin family protein [Myxococcales bacterium]
MSVSLLICLCRPVPAATLSKGSGASDYGSLGVIYLLILFTLYACKSQPDNATTPNKTAEAAAYDVVERSIPAINVTTVPMKPEIRQIIPTDGSLLPVIAAELDAADREGRDLLVYVGATWCEPCKRFHDAVVAGELDDTFPTLRLLEFDHDRDGDRLRDAGYSSRMIPLFVAPDVDGRPTDARHAGAVKGDGAVQFLVPRLKRLLEQRRHKLPL